MMSSFPADIISILDVQGYDKDIKWRFTKRAGESGLYNAPAQPLSPDEKLVSIRAHT